MSVFKNYKNLLIESVKPIEYNKNVTNDIYIKLLQYITNDQFDNEVEFTTLYKNKELIILIQIDDINEIEAFASDNIIQIIIPTTIYNDIITHKNDHKTEIISTILHELLHINQNIENRSLNFKDNINVYNSNIEKYINSSIETEVIMRGLIHVLADNYAKIDKNINQTQEQLYSNVLNFNQTKELKLFLKYATNDKKKKLKIAFFRYIANL